MVTMLGACGDDPAGAFPEEDAQTEDAPTFDIPTMDAGNDVGTVDRGTPPVDRGTVDRGGGNCPASCTTSAECDPCRTGDTPDTVRYCCISGLCVSMTGSCTVAGDGGTPDGMGDAAEGGSPTDGPDLDDAPDPDDGSGGDKDVATPPPVDAASEAGTTTDAGTTSMDASVMDATAAD